MNRWLQNACANIREHWRAYVLINVAYYGLTVACMVFVVFFPEVQRNLLQAIRQYASHDAQGVMKSVFSAYAEGRLAAAIALTFAVNLIVGCVLSITVPSLIVPFSGLIVALFRAAVWGLFMSPVDRQLRWVMAPHSLTLLLEGQAYVVAMLAAYQEGLAVLRPSSAGADTRWQGFVAGLRRTASSYILIVILLAVAAVYESLEVIFLAPLLKPR